MTDTEQIEKDVKQAAKLCKDILKSIKKHHANASVAATALLTMYQQVVESVPDPTIRRLIVEDAYAKLKFSLKIEDELPKGDAYR